MANNLMICTSAVKALHLNESENSSQKYILEGIFAELDKLNRNQRIYPKEEYLKHLSYLRKDIESGEPLLGELDHPDDRFEVKLKEASHRVIDLWYDAQNNVVMGKIELLNTPNGKLAQSIVDQGIPLHISSRAAGSVNSDNTVSIQQIYTYDLVCKPGFAGAVLHRVNESADAPQYSPEVRDFLNSSLKAESMNVAPQYGFLCEDVNVTEMKASAALRKEAVAIQDENSEINNQIDTIINDMTKPLFENTNPDATVGKPLDISGNGASALGIPTALEGEDKKEEEEKKDDVSDKPAEANDKPAESSDDKKEDNKEEKCPKCGKSPCECGKEEGCDGDKCTDDKKEKESVSEDEEEKAEDDSDKKDDDNDSKEDSGEESGDDEKSEDSGIEIIDVEAEFEGDDKSEDDMIKDVEPDFGEEGEDEGDSEQSEEGEGEAEDHSEEGEEDKKDTDEAERTVDCNGDASKGNKLYDQKESKEEADKFADKAQKEIDSDKEKIMKKLDDLRASIEKKNKTKEESKCESIIMAQYPVSMMMNESNFAEFVSLSESQKNKVVAYLQDNAIVTRLGINESWKNGVDYVAETPVWLKYAPANYKEMYEAASETVKKSIATTATYVLFESQQDINNFWENSGLAANNERRLLNESFVNNMPKVTAESNKESGLPYSADYIKMIADMACEYNRK